MQTFLVSIFVIAAVATGGWWYLNYEPPAEETPANTAQQTNQTIPRQRPGQPSVTEAPAGSIQASTVTGTGNPVVAIEGTAAGNFSFGIRVSSERGQEVFDSPLSVSNGRWSVQITNPSLPAGRYRILLYAAVPQEDGTMRESTVASGSLVIE